MRHIHQPLGHQVPHLPLARCHTPYTPSRCAPSTSPALLFDQAGHTITFTLPVSSSSVRNSTPLAVPGRWRTVTMPQARASWPFGEVHQHVGRQEALASRLRPQQRQRMAAQRQALRAVVADDLLAFAGRASSGVSSSRRGRAQQVLVRHRAHRLPQAWRRCPASFKRIGAGQHLQVAAVQVGAARQVGHARGTAGSRARARCARRPPCSSRAAATGRGAPPAGARAAVRIGSSSADSQPLIVTSTGRTSMPWRRASCTSCDGL
jgi:hypothetical protein